MSKPKYWLVAAIPPDGCLLKADRISRDFTVMVRLDKTITVRMPIRLLGDVELGIYDLKSYIMALTELDQMIDALPPDYT